MSQLTKFAVIALSLATGVIGVLRPARAAPRRTTGQTVLVLLVAKDPAGQRREARFTQELKLLLQPIAVVNSSLRQTGFAAETLGSQISHVRNQLRQRQSVAVAWLSQPTPKLILLHLVVVSMGRALVRLVEARVGQEASESLAIAARELLGTAYLFDRASGGARSSLGRIVSGVRRRVAGRLELGPRPPRLSLVLDALVNGGIVGQQGPTVCAGGLLKLEWRPIERLHLGIGMLADGGPIGTLQDGSVTGWSTGVLLGGAYLWQLGRVSVGPLIEIHARWTGLRVQVGQGPKVSDSFFQFGIGVAAELRVRLTRRLSLAMVAGLPATPIQRTYSSRTSTNERFWATPYLSWQARLGIRLSL